MKKEHTEILKVKIDDAGQVDLQLLDRQSGWTWTGTCNRVCHQDLPDALQELKKVMAKSNELLIDSKEKVAQQHNQRILDSITITGVSWKGDDENRAIVITGKRTVLHTGVAMNSPRISLNGDSFGFEGEALKPLAGIITEVQEYLFNMKGSLLEGSEEESEEEVTVEEEA